MKSSICRVFSTLPFLLAVTACGGGGGGGGGGNVTGGGSVQNGKVSFAVSDAPVDGLSAVVITIDGIEVRRKGVEDCDADLDNGDCIFINRFTTDAGDAETVQVDLLALQGANNQIIVQDVDMEAGEYDQLRLSVIDEDTNFSYVKEIRNGDILWELKVPSEELKLGGFTVKNSGSQVFVLEFDLRKAMTYNPGPDRYILKPRGIRIVEVASAARISGVVQPALFSDNGVPRCANKFDPNVGNVVYLYQGHGLAVQNLADNIDRTIHTDVPASLITPFTSQRVAANGRYEIAYLPPGDYTLAFTCEAENDEPSPWDRITIPSPANERVEISIAEGESRTCNLPVIGGSC